MPEWWASAPAFVLALSAGLLLGAVFFGGLWWTVRRGVSSPRPAAWFLGSLLVRTGIILAGFYFASDGQGDRLLACLAGFVIARLLVIRFVIRFVTRLAGPPVEAPSSPAQEAGHAA